MHPQRTEMTDLVLRPGRLNVKLGLLMVVSALCLGMLLDQVQPLPSSSFGSVASESTAISSPGNIDWSQLTPDQIHRFAWRICYAHLGNMGLINIGGGLALVVMGSRIRANLLLSRVLWMGGLLHPGSWLLVGITGIERWRWLGRIGAVGVAVVLGLLLLQLFLPQRWLAQDPP